VSSRFCSGRFPSRHGKSASGDYDEDEVRTEDAGVSLHHSTEAQITDYQRLDQAVDSMCSAGSDGFGTVSQRYDQHADPGVPDGTGAQDQPAATHRDRLVGG
jgi:hypothetical protein